MAYYIFPPLWSQYSADFFTVWPEKGERAAGRERFRDSEGVGLRANSPLGIPVLLFTVFLFQLLHLHGADLQREAK